jgi:hypothetical protein
MFHRSALLSVPILFMIISAAPCQDRFVIFSQSNWTNPAGLHEIDASGNVISTLAILPAGFSPSSMVMAEDNLSFRVTGTFVASGKGALLDVSAAGVVTTLLPGGTVRSPSCMVRDSDGDWLLMHKYANTTVPEILKIQGSSLVRLCTLQQLTPFGMAIIEDSGNLVIRGIHGSPVQGGYFQVDPYTGTLVTFAPYQSRTASPNYGARYPVYDPKDGSFIDATFTTTGGYTELVRANRKSGVSWFSPLPTSGMPIDFTDAGPRSGYTAYYTLIHRFTTPWTFDIAGVRRDGTWLKPGTIHGVTPDRFTFLLRKGSRHLTWFMTRRPNGRCLQLSFPGEAGRTFVVGFSMSGVHPGIILKDGRMIPLVIDPLTVLGLNGGVPGILDNTVGRLDAFGKARITVDTNAFGSALKGVQFQAAALLLDSTAPDGILHIVGPTVLSIRE